MRDFHGDKGTYRVLGPAAYRGKPGCESPYCTRSPSFPETCYGWHCAYCDAPCSMMGHRCDAGEAILGEARKALDEGMSA